MSDVARGYEGADALLGDMAQFGGRYRLPEGNYPMKFSIDGVGFTKDRETGAESTPYVNLLGEVVDGPFKGEEMVSRLMLTFGKQFPPKGKNKGGFIGFLNHATKAITGKPVDLGAMEEYEFPTPGDFAGDAQGYKDAASDHFFSLEPEARAEFMAKYVRLGSWDGKTAIAVVGHDTSEVKEETTGVVTSRTFARWQGFHATNDPKAGLAHWKRVWLPRQVELAEKLANEPSA